MKMTKEHIDDMVKDLREEAEELKMKLHLAKMEVGDEWGKVEAKLDKLEAKASEIGEATAEASEDVWAATKLLGEEIRDGFKSIARHF